MYQWHSEFLTMMHWTKFWISMHRCFGKFFWKSTIEAGSNYHLPDNKFLDYRISTMAVIAGHHWVALMLIASAAGEVLRDPTATRNTTTIKLIAAPSLTLDYHPKVSGQPKNSPRPAPIGQPAWMVYTASSTPAAVTQVRHCPCPPAQQLFREREGYRPLQARSTAWPTSQATHTSRSRPKMANPTR